jgi:ABC-type Fe3+-hydroxamate transport system, periplasmic component
MKKYLIVLLSALMILSPLAAQATLERTEAENATFLFTDSLGREREIPRYPSRVAPSGNVAQVQLYTIANDLMVGNAGSYSDGAKQYLTDSNVNLPVLGAFYGKKANLNKEALIVCDPQVVIDFGEIKGSVEAMSSDLDNLEKQINIPILFIESYLRNTPASYRMLGVLLGREAEAEKLALYAEKAINKADKERANIEKPVKIYYSTAPDALDAVPTGNFHGEVIELVGAENVIPATKGSGSNQISLETLFTNQPEVILLGNEEAYKLVTTDKTWAELDAVKNGRVYLLPLLPYPWIDSPPSVNRIIGIYHLGTLLYPELYKDVDIKAEVKEFYSLFYKCDLTDAQVENLLH